MRKFFMLLAISNFFSKIDEILNGKETDIFEYRVDYPNIKVVVSAFFIDLPLSDFYRSLKIQKKQKPCEVTVHYDDPGLDLHERERIVTRNAGAFFAILCTYDIARFVFPDETYVFTRSEMEERFGVDFKEIQDEDELDQVLNSTFEKEEPVGS